MKYGKTLSLFLMTFWSFNSQASMNKMDIHIHDMVIEKLEGAVQNIDHSSVAHKVPVILRLGDLYSDRARMKFILEIEKNCDKCMASQDDRLRAIQLYQKAFPLAGNADKTRLLLHMAHLHKISGQRHQSRNLFRRILKEGQRRHGAKVMGQAYFGLGELDYEEAKYQTALKFYRKALGISQTPRRGFITYKLAWSYLNTNRQSQAIATMTALLKNTDLLTSDPTTSRDGRNTFHEDVSRDFATFIARRKIKNSDIDLLIKLSPPQSQKPNLFFLGTEAERLGQKSAAVTVWGRYLAFGKPSEVESLDIQVRLAQIEFDLGRKSSALESYQKALNQWRKNGCKSEDVCKEIHIRLRNFVTSWNKFEYKNPTKNLLQAYQSYLLVFKDDLEIYFWAGQAGLRGRHFKESVSFFHSASEVAKDKIHNKDFSKVSEKKTRDIFEGSLVGEMEAAEALGDSNLRLKAYAHYLKRNPNGPMSAEARYQIAHVHYDEQKYEKSAQLFKDIATDGSLQNNSIKLKSADLALDCLVLIKDNKKIQIWSKELAKAHPQRSFEYASIARKSAINHSQKVIDHRSSSQSDYHKELMALLLVDLKGMNQKEKIAYYKNLLILAEKNQDLETMKRASRQLLSVRNLPKGEKTMALQALIFVAEAQLDFSTALKTLKQLEEYNKSEENTLLRAGLLAELAGHNSEKYYLKFIDKTRSIRKANEIRAQIVRNSRSPWRRLDEMKSKLSRTPDILANLALETFARYRNLKRAKSVLKVRGVRKTIAGQTLFRFVTLPKISQMDRQIAGHKLSNRSSKSMQRSIARRLELLNKIEQEAKSILKGGDGSLQIHILSLLAQENLRFYGELRKLPVPKGLNKKQKLVYMQNLKARSLPYYNSAQLYQTKLNQVWKVQASYIETLKKLALQPGDPLHKLARQELVGLKPLAPLPIQSDIAEVQASFETAPSRQKILHARKELKRDPFDLDKMSSLKSLEQQAGGTAMVAFLEARMKTVRKMENQ